MQIAIYLFAFCFLCMAAAMMYAYKRTRHYGLFLIGLAYGGSAIFALIAREWWPLVAGFVLAWMLRMMGLDPDTDKAKAAQQDQMPDAKQEAPPEQS